MLRGLFVTGTDTCVGKTVAAAALLCRYRGEIPLRYWKPIQTGIEQDDDTAEVRRLSDASDDEIFAEGIRLPNPVSPHLAAQQSGQTIDLLFLGDMARRRASARHDQEKRWIVEGAGGALVPVNDTALMTDLMALLDLPVLIVARNALGTINHTLLTLEALRARGRRIAGVLMSGSGDGSNAKAIEHYGKISVINEIPHFHQLPSKEFKQWAETEFDPKGSLLEFLQ